MVDPTLMGLETLSNFFNAPQTAHGAFGQGIALNARYAQVGEHIMDMLFEKSHRLAQAVV